MERLGKFKIYIKFILIFHIPKYHFNFFLKLNFILYFINKSKKLNNSNFIIQ